MNFRTRRLSSKRFHSMAVVARAWEVPYSPVEIGVTCGTGVPMQKTCVTDANWPDTSRRPVSGLDDGPALPWDLRQPVAMICLDEKGTKSIPTVERLGSRIEPRRTEAVLVLYQLLRVEWKNQSF